jgi:hypothetical protein
MSYDSSFFIFNSRLFSLLVQSPWEEMAVFWVVASCYVVEVYQRSRGPCCLHHQGDSSLSDGKLLPDYTVLQPRRQLSLYSPPWEPEILHLERKLCDPTRASAMRSSACKLKSGTQTWVCCDLKKEEIYSVWTVCDTRTFWLHCRNKLLEPVTCKL